MAKPETLKDLMIAGDLTMGEARRLTRKVFNDVNVLEQDLIPYQVTLPVFDSLPDHVQQFLIKAVLEASIVNVMENQIEVLGDDNPDEGFDEEAHHSAFGSDGDS